MVLKLCSKLFHVLQFNSFFAGTSKSGLFQRQHTGNTGTKLLIVCWHILLLSADTEISNFSIMFSFFRQL